MNYTQNRMVLKIFLLDTTIVLSIEKPLKGVIQYTWKNEGFYDHENNLIGDVTDLLDEIQMNHTGETIYMWGLEPERLLSIFSNELLNVVAAGGLVVNPQGEILFIKRKGRWDLPKGKPDHGEDLKQTAIREVEEECNISGLKILSELPDTYHIYELLPGCYVLKKSCWYYMMVKKKQVPSPQYEEEITQAIWISRPVPGHIKEGAFLSIKELMIYFENHY
jgi:8-oxo-dGTP pyrophosphatase MutT (NUDIX family)